MPFLPSFVRSKPSKIKVTTTTTATDTPMKHERKEAKQLKLDLGPKEYK